MKRAIVIGASSGFALAGYNFVMTFVATRQSSNGFGSALAVPKVAKLQLQ